MNKDTSWRLLVALFLGTIVLVWAWATTEFGVLDWIEKHPGTASWVQAVGSIAAIAVAISIPWYIHVREQNAAQNARLAYRVILRDALEDLEFPLGWLSTFDVRPDGNEIIEIADPADRRAAREREREVAIEVASDMGAALSKMTQAASILDELKTIEGIDSFEVIRSLFHLRRKLRTYLPMMEREAVLLNEYPTPSVVEVAINKLQPATEDLLQAVQDAQQALRSED